MCEGRASIAVDHDGVEGACSGREVLPVGLLTRPRLDRSWSCEWVTGAIIDSTASKLLFCSSFLSTFNPITFQSLLSLSFGP